MQPPPRLALRVGRYDNGEPFLAEAQHCAVELDATPGVQGQGVADAAHRRVEVGGAEVLQRHQGIGAGDVELRVRREVEECHRLAGRAVFLCDWAEPARSPVGVRPAPRLTGSVEPERPLPPVGFAEVPPGRRQAIRERCPPHSPRRVRLRMRVVHGVEPAKALPGALVQIVTIALCCCEPRDVHAVASKPGAPSITQSASARPAPGA